MSKNPRPSSQNQEAGALLPDRSPVEIQGHKEALQRDITFIESAPVESLNLTKNWGQEQVKEEGTSSQKLTKKIIPNRIYQKKVPWTKDEHSLFLLGLKTHGKGQWQAISRHVLTSKTPTQIASHAQKYFLRQNNMPKKRKRASIHDLTLGDIDLAPQQNQVPPLIPMQQSSPQQNRVSPLDVPQQLPIQNRVLPLNVPQQSSPQQNRGSSLNVPQPLPIQQNMVLPLNVPQQSSPQQNRVLPLDVPQQSSPQQYRVFPFNLPQQSSPQQNSVFPLNVPQQSSPQQYMVFPLNVPQQSSPQQNSVFPLNVPQQSSPQQNNVFHLNFPQQLPNQQNMVLPMSFPQQSWPPPSNVLMQQLQERQHTLEESYLAPFQYHWAPPFVDPPMEQLQERPHVQGVFQPKPNECLGTCCCPGTLAFTEKQKMNGPLMNSDGSPSSLYVPNTFGPIRQCGSSNKGFMHFSDGF